MDIPNWLQALPYVGSGLSIVNSLFNRGSSSEELINQQFENNVRMWNMNNRYNSPSAQVSRLRAAGLNPMFYGIDGKQAAPLQPVDVSGAQSASTNESMRKQQAFQNALDFVRQLQETSSALEVNQSQIDKNNADADLADANAEAVRTQIPGYAEDVDKKRSDAIKSRFEASLLMSQFNDPAVRSALVEMPKLERDKVLSEIALFDAEKLLRHADVEVDAAKILELATQAKLNTAQLAVVKATAFQLQKLGELYRSQKITEVQFRKQRLALLEKQIKVLYNEVITGSKDIDWYELDKIIGYFTSVGNTFYSKGRK